MVTQTLKQDIQSICYIDPSDDLKAIQELGISLNRENRNKNRSKDQEENIFKELNIEVVR